MILIMDWLGIGRLTEFNILKEPDRRVYCDFICPLMGNLNSFRSAFHFSMPFRYMGAIS
jgi:hypothetical protein